MTENSLLTDFLWILAENLCFEHDPGTPAGVKFGFQTRFCAHPSDNAKVIYHHFAEMDARLVFYWLGANAGCSLCLLSGTG